MYISSQRYLDDETVQAKRAAKDYIATVSPMFVIDGVEMQAIIDGHHSLEAAKLDGVDPVIVVATKTQDDRIALLDKSVDVYLEASFVDSAWYDVSTGKDVF